VAGTNWRTRSLRPLSRSRKEESDTEEDALSCKRCGGNDFRAKKAVGRSGQQLVCTKCVFFICESCIDDITNIALKAFLNEWEAASEYRLCEERWRLANAHFLNRIG